VIKRASRVVNHISNDHRPLSRKRNNLAKPEVVEADVRPLAEVRPRLELAVEPVWVLGEPRRDFGIESR